MATITPTIRLRRLGMALRDHREAAGVTLEEAARVLMRSPSSLSRIEKGLHHLPVRDLEYVLGVHTEEFLGRSKCWTSETAVTYGSLRWTH